MINNIRRLYYIYRMRYHTAILKRHGKWMTTVLIPWMDANKDSHQDGATQGTAND